MQPPPMIMIRMRCPRCRTDGRFLTQYDTPLPALPEIFKQTCRCNCRNHIPKVNRTTPLLKSLMSINGVPYRQLIEQMHVGGQETMN